MNVTSMAVMSTLQLGIQSEKTVTEPMQYYTTKYQQQN